LLAHGRNAAKALNAKYNYRDHNLYIVCFDSIFDGWAGKARVGTRGATGFTAPSPRSLFGFRLARWGGSFCGVDLKSNEHDPEAFQLDDPVQLRGLRPGG